MKITESKIYVSLADVEAALIDLQKNFKLSDLFAEPPKDPATAEKAVRVHLSQAALERVRALQITQVTVTKEVKETWKKSTS